MAYKMRINTKFILDSKLMPGKVKPKIWGCCYYKLHPKPTQEHPQGGLHEFDIILNLPKMWRRRTYDMLPKDWGKKDFDLLFTRIVEHEILHAFCFLEASKEEDKLYRLWHKHQEGVLLKIGKELI